MAPFIHYNMILLKELNFVLEKKSIKYLISFHKNNINSIFFKKEHFYDACFNNNLNIIKYIYNHLQNKNIDFNEALFLSCNQYNTKIIKWLNNINSFSKDIYYECLKKCVNYNNIKLFKYFINKFNLDLFYNNSELIYFSIKKRNIDFINYILKEKKDIILINDSNIIKNICYLNDYDLIKLLFSKINNFIFNFNYISILEDVIKLGYDKTLDYILEIQQIKYIMNDNIKKYVYHSFYSNNVNILKKIMNLNNNVILNYDFMYNQLIIHGNLDIIKYLYEKNNSFDLYNFIAIEKIFKNRFYDILLFIIENKPLINYNDFYFKEFEKLINYHFLKIILNIDNDKIIKFKNFISSNNIFINESIISKLINNLLIYNQINKIETIDYIYYNKICYDDKTLFNDSLKSHNMNCINYALDKLNLLIDDYKYDILFYSYLNGINNIINLLDDNNDFQFYTYNLLLNKNIYRNDANIINKIINKNDFDINIINDETIEMIFKLGNSKILNLLLPKFKNFDFININIIYEIINNDNYEIIINLEKYVDFKEKINPGMLMHISKYGNIKFIEWFVNLNLDYENYISSSFNTLILYGNYEQAIYFYNLKSHKEYIDLSNNTFHLIRDVIKNNNYNMFQWFLNNFNDINNLQFIIFLELQENIIEICKYDNIDILNFTLKKYNLDNNNLIKILFNYAFDNFKVNIINYLISNYNIKNYKLDINIKNIFYNSIRNNNYNIIDIVIKNFKNHNWLYLISQLNDNSVNLFTYILKNYKENLNINEELFFTILYQGKLNYLKIFVDFCSDVIDFKKIGGDDYLILFTHNNIELIDFVYSLNNIDLNNNYNILKLVVNLNKTSITKWLLDKFTFDNLHDDEDFYFYSAIIYKNLEMLKLLYKYDDIESFEAHKLKYLKLASKIKDLSIFIWISNKFDEIDYSINNYELINNSLGMNNFHVLKYILDYNEIDINYNDSVLIITAYGNNLNEVIKFLFNKYDNINVLARNEIAMKYAIEDADVEMIDLLYSYNNNFDLSIDNEYLFRIACKMDNIEVVKWLISKKSDINHKINNYEIFYYVCDHNYIDIALYLKSLDPIIYNVEVKDNQIENYSVNKLLKIDGTKFIECIDKCPICLDNESELITECDHQYCTECLNHVNNKNYSFNCPLCRADINTIKLIKKIVLEN